MIDLLFILLMQAVTGDPAAQPAQADPSTAASAADTTTTATPTTVAPGQVVVLVPDEPAYEGARCERTAGTGSRVRRTTVCTTAQSRTEARETATELANSGGRVQRGQ
jgi:hypothetical protein